MEIDLLKLKDVMNLLLDHIVVTRGVQSFEIEQANYWNIPTEEIYDATHQPSALDIGSLIDDWEFLLSLLDKENEPVTYQLTQLAPLIRYLGETLGKDLAKDGG